ncbi:MAG: hypothetical protein J3Q66DRAFT_65020 [Benniella sp.]|nr:MAG: hypothetical protein J3Q66DRAFT_65020 [Benniella sp.]
MALFAADTNPLEIPEIRLMVGQHLERSDLARCLRVCKSWHTSFSPMVWSTIVIWPYIRHPTLESLHRHMHLVKKLEYYTVLWTANDPVHHINLSLRKVFSKEHHSDLSLRKVFRKEDDRHQYDQLRELTICWDVAAPLPTRSIWKPTHSLLNLLKLKIDQVDIDPAATEVFWDLCTRLHSLDIRNTGIARLPDKCMKFERLLRLDVSLESGYTYDQELDWITQCPNLTKLSWRHCELRAAPSDTFANRVANGTWPGLSDLRLGHSYPQEASPARIAQVMRQIRAFSIMAYRIDMAFLTALRPHFHTLRELDIAFDHAVAGPAVSEILASCPCLKNFNLSRVMSQDIIQGPPWVCGSSMRYLRVNVMISPGQDADRHQQLVLERVSHLVNLDSLTLDQYGPLQSTYLSLRLGKGLEQLSTLKQLSFLKISNYLQELSQADVQWMIEHWKSLSYFHGTVNKAVDERIVPMLKEAGVNADIHTSTFRWSAHS